MQTETWILGWGCFVVILAVLRSRRRRLEWRNQPGLTVLSSNTTDSPDPTQPETQYLEESAGTPDVVTRQTPTTDGTPGQISRIDADPPAVAHIVPPDVAEYVIPDFRPEQDTCKVDLCYPDIDFVHWRTPGMAAMMFTDGDEALTVFFQGLDAVPFDGVFVRFHHPRKGPQCYLLSELLDVRESEISQDEAALKLDAKRDALEAAQGIEDGPKQFHDFDSRKECIEVFVPEERLASTAVSISATPDGSDALVLVDGRIAAVLIGAFDAGPHNVKLVAVDQTAAA